ncbi:hypothetical protein HCJ93_24125 [Streptomyces sp. SBST2-5]|uniref:UL36 very large tegument protein n=1 Tax=Streptomyces composti TaxID=2720025 RepID=A0ABX1AHJ4_9ACTN|nr:hypothetical protein [Streptomyces composti]NJP53071.1 hypothetical protein [Streptomyces composti]
MAVEQIPAQVREFRDYLGALLGRLDQSGGWCAVFWQRDPDGMRACLAGSELPPWDVVEALLQDYATAHGAPAAEAETARARALHAAALTAYDARPGARQALTDRLDVMLRERRYAAERRAALSRALTVAATGAQAEAIRVDLAWAEDDHARATARCAELRSRLERLEHPERREHTEHPDRREYGQAVRGVAGERHPAMAREREQGPAPAREGERRPVPVREGERRPASVGEDERGPAAAREGGHVPASARPASRGIPAARSRPAPGGGRTPGRAPGAPDRVPAPGAPWSIPAPRAPEPGPAPAGDVALPAPADAVPAPPAPAPGAAPPEQPARAPEPAPGLPEPPTTPKPPKPRKRRRGSARFAGAVEDDDTPPVVLPPDAGPPPAHGAPADAPAPPRRPRGARFAGVETEEEPARPRVPVADDGASRQEARRAVAHLARLRAEGRTGEAHVLLVDLARWPPERFPLLAAEMERAGLTADWATLLWECASLPAGRLVTASETLAAAGRAADAEQLLRQGVARPAEEIGRAVVQLTAERRHHEVTALLDACVRTRTPGEAARSAAVDPERLVPLLLGAAQGVSEECYWDLVHALRVAGTAG